MMRSLRRGLPTLEIIQRTMLDVSQPISAEQIQDWLQASRVPLKAAHANLKQVVG